MHHFATKILARIIKEYINNIEKESYQKGYYEGINYQKNITLTPLIKPVIHEQPVVKEDYIYGPVKLRVSPEDEASMRRDVAEAVALGVVSPPTEDQWKMVLSNHPATCVIAGAGSGKSTTLVLRVAFMLCYLGVRPSDMTVVSFTRESCKELREKLFKVLSFERWQGHLTQSDADDLKNVCDKLISTFHKALSSVAKVKFKGINWFDMLKDGNSDDNDDDDLDNPFASSSKLSELQKSLLLEAYIECFSKDKIFKKNVVSMLSLRCKQNIFDDEAEKIHQNYVITQAGKRDFELVTRINEKWKDTGWDVAGITVGPIEVFNENNVPFYANGIITETGMPVFLSLNGFIDKTPLFTINEKLAEGTPDEFPINGSLKVKKDIISHFCGIKVLHLRSLS